MKQAHKFIAVTMSIGLLSGCGLYIHDASLQQSAESSRTLVSEADLSKQINDELAGAADLAKRQEAAIIGFYTMQRNEQLLALLQPDVLEANAFADSGDTASFIKKGGGYGRNPADLNRDIAYAINCRLDDLIAASSITCLLDQKTALRDRDTLTTLRNTSFPELQFQDSAGLAATIESVRVKLVEAIDEEAKKDPDLPDDPRGKMSCADISEKTRTDAKTAKLDPADPVGSLFIGYANLCNLAATLPTEPLVSGAAKDSALDAISKRIKDLRAEREDDEIRGFKLAADMKKVLREIAAAQGPGPTEAALKEKLGKIQDALKQGKGLAKLAGLRELADKTDQLLQIELNQSAADASGTAAPAASGAAAASPTGLTASGQAVVHLASAGAAAIDAYRDEAPSARAQSLIIARVALTQQIEVAALESALVETKLRLLIAKRDFMVNEIHLLSEAGLYLTRSELGSEQTHLALLRIAAAWDTGRIEEEAITYREFAAERETAIRISASNAKNLQAAVLAAADQIVAYAQGGITKETIADTFAKLFIGGALLK
jgi:hypothetical protein